MIWGFLMVLFTISVVLGTLLAMLMLIGSSIYDVALQQEKRYNRITSKTRKLRYRPKVSIVVPCFNEELTIERCLDQLKKLRYRKIEIIVVDDKSKDKTCQITRQYIKDNPNRDIKLVAKRKNGGRGAAINSGVKKATGEIVVAFDADCVYEPDSIHKMVERFADPKVNAVAGNVRIMDDGTLLGMMQRLEYLVSFRSKKFNTVTNSEFIIGGAGASYRRSVLQKAGGFDDRMKTEDIEFSVRLTRLLGKDGGLIYASDYVIHTEPVPTYRGLFRQRFRWKFGSLQGLYHNRSIIFSTDKNQNPFTGWIRLPASLWSEFMLLLEPIFFTAFVYIAIANKNPWLFIGASAAYTVVTWLAIWSDEHLKLTTRLHLTALAPFMYVASFVMSLVQVTAALRSLFAYRSMTGKKEISGAYVSTQRMKQQLEVSS